MSNMLTYSGRSFNPEKPNRSMISVIDISHGLAMNPRFNGQLEDFYSVAEHSLMVEEILCLNGFDFRSRLLGLFHDGEEAYTGDIPSPIKIMLKPAITEVAEPIKRAIYSRLGIKPPTDEQKKIIKFADEISFVIEVRDLRKKQHFQIEEYLEKANVPMNMYDKTKHLKALPIGPKYAKIKFFERYLELIEQLDI